MPAVTRVNDSTSGTCDPGDECCPHGRSGTNKQGSKNVFVNSKPLHRKGDTGSCNCPHGGTYKSVKGSKTVYCNKKSATRIGDTTKCTGCGKSGKHTSGSPNVFIDDISKQKAFIKEVEKKIEEMLKKD